MIAQSLGAVCAQLSSAQGQIPSTDVDSVAALAQAYKLIAQVQQTYQGQ